MKVAILCHSDIYGGASIVTFRLAQALCGEGVETTMLVAKRYDKSATFTRALGSRLKRRRAFMLERLGIFMRNGFSRPDLFKVSTASHGISVVNDPAVRDADVVVLSWINQGLLSLKELERLTSMNKPIVWMMHDMWPFTGICHHSLGCSNYERECGDCQFLHTRRGPNDLSHRVFERKRAIYERSNITFVAVSNWLKELARRSSLLREADIRVIANPVPVDTFPIESRNPLSDSKRIIMMGAARLDDPIKGLPDAIAALNHICDTQPDLTRECEALFYGNIFDPESFKKLRFPYRYVGPIYDRDILRNMFAAADVVISSSRFETLPTTLVEGLAAGAIPVSYDRGGQRDIITHKANGYLATAGDTTDLANGIVWALNNPIGRDAQHRDALNRFNSDVIARRYIDLFNELLKK